METLVATLLEIVGGLLWAMLEGIAVALFELIVDTVQWIWRKLRGRRGEAAPDLSEPVVSPSAIPVAETVVVRRGDDFGRIVLGLVTNVALGFVVGCLSLFAMPDHMLASPTMRVVMVPVSAIFCALAVPRISVALGRTAESSIAIARPSNAFVLALTISLMRLFGAR